VVEVLVKEPESPTSAGVFFVVELEQPAAMSKRVRAMNFFMALSLPDDCCTA
jgi:hypothetical protein